MKRPPRIRVIAAAVGLILFAPPQSARAIQYVDTTLGYSFTYPDDWMVERHDDGSVTVRNFPRGKYLHGGSPPMGGAYLMINSYPPYPSWWPPDTDEYKWLEHFGQTFNAATVLAHPSRSTPGPARLVYTLESLAGPRDTHVSIALRKGGRLFRMALAYQTDDSNGPEYEQILSAIIDSLALTVSATAVPVGPSPGATAVATP